MKKVVVAMAAGLMACTPAFADKQSYVENAYVRDNYKNITKRVPTTYQSCEVVQVPIYGTTRSGMNTEGAIIGGIIGGVLGNSVVKGGGKSTATGAGAVAGAIIGGNHGNKQREIVGYREQQVCRDVTTYDESNHTVYGHSTITFTYEGRTYSLNFQK